MLSDTRVVYVPALVVAHGADPSRGGVGRIVGVVNVHLIQHLSRCRSRLGFGGRRFVHEIGEYIEENGEEFEYDCEDEESLGHVKVVVDPAGSPHVAFVLPELAAGVYHAAHYYRPRDASYEYTRRGLVLHHS